MVNCLLVYFTYILEISIIPESGSEHSALVWYKKHNITKGYKTVEYYEQSVSNFFTPYAWAEQHPKEYANCPEERKTKNKPCLFKKSDLGECNDFKYNNNENDICIYIKLGNVNAKRHFI